ncbi:uncharacterized protein BO72DRAFT_98402 [Aspergillus fijiensis CBS 313.89]|uniref:Uncharacterized protein n=1 Tax=Aspergillus fijiensis CBS 313.89 TaxID=1448319 RepID=A0A8G1W2B7_9EURO|nr:uncharacterized protein BO72DRAFT_98402 [Aspergillus fijiensis CBS 313.89]RAK77884.1 hypothetical protein BO72DRAFT_98402 [Aspergillus fijiensis CBS 313.89]
MANFPKRIIGSLIRLTHWVSTVHCRSNVRQWCVEATSKDEIGVHDGRGVVYGVLHIVLALNMLASFRGYWPRILPARRRRHLLYLKTRL